MKEWDANRQREEKTKGERPMAKVWQRRHMDRKKEKDRGREIVGGRGSEMIGCLAQTIQAISLPICISQRVAGERNKFLLISYYPFLCKCPFDLFVIPIWKCK